MRALQCDAVPSPSPLDPRHRHGGEAPEAALRHGEAGRDVRRERASDAVPPLVVVGARGAAAAEL